MSEVNRTNLYNNLRAASPKFTMSESTFYKALDDDIARERIWKNLPSIFKGFDVPYEVFSKDMELEKSVAPSKPQRSLDNILRPSADMIEGYESRADATGSLETPQAIRDIEREEQEKERDVRSEKLMREEYLKSKHGDKIGETGQEVLIPQGGFSNSKQFAASMGIGNEGEKMTDSELKAADQKARDEYAQEVYDRRYLNNPDGTPKDSYGKDLFEAAMAGVGTIALTPYMAVEMVEDMGISAENAIRGTNFQRGTGTLTTFMNTVLGGNYLRSRVEHYAKEADRYQDGKGITSSALEGDLSTATGKAILATVQTLPNLAVSIYSGKKGFETLGGMFLGVTAGLQKYDEIKDNEDLDAADKVLAVFGAITAEAVPEIIGAKRYGKMFNKQTIGTLRKEVSEEVVNIFKKFKDVVKKLGGKAWDVYMERFGEGTTEVMTDIINLAIDITIGLKDNVTGKDIMNLGDSFIVGQLSDKIPSGIHKIQREQYTHAVQKEIEDNAIAREAAAFVGADAKQLAAIAARKAYQETVSDKDEELYNKYVDAIAKGVTAVNGYANIIEEAGLTGNPDAYTYFSMAVGQSGMTDEEVQAIVSKDAKDITDEEKDKLNLLAEDMRALAGGPQETTTEEEVEEKKAETVHVNPTSAEVPLYDDKGKFKKHSTIFYSGDIIYNEDGSINVDESENLRITNRKGEELKGRKRDEAIEELNSKLRVDKKIEVAKENRVKEREAKEKQQQEAQAAEQQQVQEEEEQVFNEVPRLADGTLHTAKATPTQTIVWNKRKAGTEEALNRLKDKVRFLANNLASEKTKFEEGKVDPDEYYAKVDKYNDYIAEAKEAAVKFLDPNAGTMIDEAVAPKEEEAPQVVPQEEAPAEVEQTPIAQEQENAIEEQAAEESTPEETETPQENTNEEEEQASEEDAETPASDEAVSESIEPVDLQADDIVIVEYGQGNSRKEFTFARKNENGELVDIGNPYRKNNGQKVGKKLKPEIWREKDKNDYLFYVKDAEGNSFPCYALSAKNLYDTKHPLKLRRGSKFNAVDARTGEPIAATNYPDAYVVIGGEETSILSDQKKKVASIEDVFDKKITARNKSEGAGEAEISVPLRRLLYGEMINGKNAISQFCQYLEDEAIKSGKDIDAYKKNFGKEIQGLINEWNEYCKENGLTNIPDQIAKLGKDDQDMFWSARMDSYTVPEVADRASLMVNDKVSIGDLREFNRIKHNPLHQLGVMIYIADKLRGGNLVTQLPGQSSMAKRQIVTKANIENARERYNDLKEGKGISNDRKKEIANLEKYYPEVLNNEPVHNRTAISPDNEKKVLKEIQDKKLQDAANKVMTDEEREAKAEEDLRKGIEDAIDKIQNSTDEEEKAKAAEELKLLTANNPAMDRYAQEIFASKVKPDDAVVLPVEQPAAEVEEEVQEETPEETPVETPKEEQVQEEQETPVDTEYEQLEQATEEVPAPEKRRKRNKKADEAADSPASQLENLVAEVNDLNSRRKLGDSSVTPAVIAEKMDEINDFISEHGDTEELWNIFNTIEYSVTPEQKAASARSRAIGDMLVRVLGRIKGLNVRLVSSQESARAILEKMSNAEEIPGENGTILGYAVGNTIFITPEGLNANTPIHEYTHLWVRALRDTNPKAWSNIVKELKRNKPLWESVTKDKAYNLTSDDAIASEVLSRYVGEKGEKLLENLAKEQKLGSDRLENTFINRAKKTINNFWNDVKHFIFDKLNITNLDDVANQTLKDMFGGKELDLQDPAIKAEMEDIKQKAIADGTFMKAPNGRPSNLNERLWLLTRTNNFKQWFGDWEKDPLHASKITDENGEPLVVYHGDENSGYDKFERQPSSHTHGFWATENRRVAAGYTKQSEAWKEFPMDAPDAVVGTEAQPGIYSLFMNVRNPFVISFADEDGGKRHWNEYPTGKFVAEGNEELGIERMVFDTREEAAEYLSQFGVEPNRRNLYELYLSTDDFVKRAAQSGLYDGVIITDVYDGNYSIQEDMTDYVALSPNQMKSVFNNGYFSTVENSIEYAYTIDELNEYNEESSNSIEAKSDRLTNAIDEAAEDPEVKSDKIHNAVAMCLDQMEGMRILQDNLAAYRRTKGEEPLPDEYDIRNKFESKDSAAMNKIKKFNATIAGELNDAVIKLGNMVSGSDFYEKYKKEVGGKNPVTLTPLEIVGRYLIARNDYERAKEGTARGLEEFERRMGVSTEQFWREFHASFDEQAIVELWNKIKQVTDFELDAAKEGGLISQEEYERLKEKKFYVPQRGFWDDVNPENKEENAELRVTREGSRSKVELSSMKKAKGGKSLAENPLVYIYRDAQEAIIKAEDNKVKIALYDMLRENRDWCETPEVGIKTPVRVTYKQVEEDNFVKLIDGLTERDTEILTSLQKELNDAKSRLAHVSAGEEEAVLDAIVELQDKIAEIQEKREEGSYSEEDTRTIYNHKNRDDKRNTIGLLIDGVQHEIIMPKSFSLTAQAFNGVKNKKGYLEAIKKISSFMAAQFTVNNPAFWIVNLPRDVLFATTKGAAEYGPMFDVHFAANLGKCQKQLNYYLRKGLVKDDGSKMATYLNEFLENGGNTGLFNNLDLEKFRYDVRKMNRKAEDSKLKKTGDVAADLGQWALLQPVANYMNEWSELTSRFAIYCSIKDMGMSTNEAVKAAHNLSVNFNRKGLGNEILNAFSSMTVFVNATLQGSSGFWRTFGAGYGASKQEKINKYLKAGAFMAFAPALLGALNAYFLPDDDDEEERIPEWIRDNYIVLPNGFVIPLPQELRPFWCLGVNIGMMMRGNRDWGGACNSVIKSFISNALPLPQNITDTANMLWDNHSHNDSYHNIGEVLTTLLKPSFMETLTQIADNKNFLGGKVRYDFKAWPEYELAPSESALYRDIAYWVYVIGGGDKKVASKFRTESIDSKMSPFWDVNPKEIKLHAFFIPSGTFDAWATIWGLGKDAIDLAQGDYSENNNNLQWKDVFLLNKFYKPNDKDAFRSRVKREAKGIVQRFDAVRDNALENAFRSGVLGEEDKVEAAAQRYEDVYGYNPTEDIIAIQANLEALQEISRQSLQRTLHLADDTQLQDVLNIEDYNSLDDAEKEVIQDLLFHLNNIKNGKVEKVDDVKIIDTTESSDYRPLE